MVQEKSVHVRFIEYMPLGHMGRELRKYPSPPVEKTGSLLSMADVKGAIDRLAAQEGLGRLSPLAGGEAPLGHGAARSYAFPCDNVAQRGSFGFIGIHSQKFCARCNRLRLTADGKIRSCLFSDSEISVSEALRTNDQEALREGLLQAVASKPRSYKQQQGTQRAMSAIGG
jgi:cyclic pyranopterin phosphate synthase